MTARRSLLALAAAAALALAACADDDPAGGAGSDPGAPPPDTALTVAEALATDAEGPLLVHGFLVDSGGEVRMCAAIAESYPPQCAGESFAVGGVAVAEMEGATTEGEVSWVDDVRLTGSFEGDVFVVSETAIAS